MTEERDPRVSIAAPSPITVELTSLAAAIEASWDSDTAYLGVVKPGNPARGQCYPTSRVVQWFYPDFEIARGTVSTGGARERHFWNVRGSEWLDLSWQQFAPGAAVEAYELLERTMLDDSPATVERCELLLSRVLAHLARGDLLRRNAAPSRLSAQLIERRGE